MAKLSPGSASAPLSSLAHLRDKFARLSKLLSLTIKNEGVRFSLKDLLYYLSRFDELTSADFTQSMTEWRDNLIALQQNSYHSHPAPPSSHISPHPKKLAEAARQPDGLHRQPKITIMTPLFGPISEGSQQTLQSIHQQDDQQMEVYFLVDRQSQTELTQLVASVIGDDQRIKIKLCANLEQNLARALNDALNECEGEFVGFLSGEDLLAENAVSEIVRVLNQQPETDVIYSDEGKRFRDQLLHVVQRPGWSRDLFLSINYPQSFLCCRTQMIRAVGGLRGRFESDIKYDLLLRLIEITERIHHIPEVLYYRQVPKNYYPAGFSADRSDELHKQALADYVERAGLQAEVYDGLFRGSFRVRRPITGRPLVSIIIPTKDKRDLLQQCIESIETKSSYRNYEIIIIDNNSTDPETLSYLASVPHRVIHDTEKFNYSRINNLGARYAAGEQLLFLNNDTRVIAPDWLEALLEHSQREEVGGVGAKLLYPDGLLQHAGIVLEPRYVAGHLNWLADVYDHGYQGMADVTRNFNSVTGACLMMRAGVFEEVKGFDESLVVTYNDVDLCLKARARGYLIVYTPYALLYHYEGVSRLSVHEDVGEVAEVQTTLRGKPVVYQKVVPKGEAEAFKLFYSRWQRMIENDVNYPPKRHFGSNSSEYAFPYKNNT